jgi:D-methionine transport system permease protein
MIEYIQGISEDLLKAFYETLQMVGIALFVSILLGIPGGIFLYVTEKGLFYSNKFLNVISGLIINIIRSIPFVILLVLLLPLTQSIIGTTIGPLAASVPLAIASTAFYARMVWVSLCEIDKGVIEASLSLGAKPLLIITHVLLRESLPGLLRGLTVTAVSLIGYSAMAGIVGGGGVGDLAIRFGYYRYETDIMFITVFFLILFVQLVQIGGDYAADKSNRK